MPTLEHNAIVDMFRENPDLAPRFLATLFHVDVPPHASAAVVESSLDQLIPVEFRADLVLELRNAAGRPVLAIVLEVQRDEDPDKKYSWPVYVAVVRARKRCGTVVLVVAPDAHVVAFRAQWHKPRIPVAPPVARSRSASTLAKRDRSARAVRRCGRRRAAHAGRAR